MFQCIFLEPSEIDRKGPEKQMEVPAQQAIELNIFPFFGLRIQNSWTVIGLALIALAAIVFLLRYCMFVRLCDAFDNHQRLEYKDRGDQRR